MEQIADALAGTREGKSWRCECPVHIGQHHLTLTPTNNGAPLVYCHQGASQTEVIAALRERGLWEPVVSQNGSGEVVAEYRYFDVAGSEVAVKQRFRRADGTKSFAWRMPDGTYGLTVKMHDLPLYGLARLKDKGPVFVTEGEKAADAVCEAGLVGVSICGGASQSDFGQAFEALLGRTVILWPDNDDPGRALMQRIKRIVDARIVAPEVPPKGDAFDYFKLGGTKEALLELIKAIPTDPWVERTATGYTVNVPESGGLVRFEFDNLEPDAAELSVKPELPGCPRDVVRAEIKLMSLSSRGSFVTEMNRMYEKVAPWPALLNRAVGLLRAQQDDADPSVNLTEIATDTRVRYMVRPFLLEDAPTILFGQGGAGKTYITLAMALAVGLGDTFIGESVIQGKVLFLDYESTDGRTKARLMRLLRGIGDAEWNDPPFIYWPAEGRPLKDLVTPLRRKIANEDVKLLIVDAVGDACGGNPKDEDVALGYFRSLARLGLPSISLAHVTKDDADQYPFGSIFWHHRARITWNVKMVREDGDVRHVGLFNRKANEDREYPPLGIKLEFEGGRDDTHTVTVSKEEVVEEFATELPLAMRLRQYLRPGERSVKQLATAVGKSEDTVSRTLRRMPDAVQRDWATDRSRLWGLLQT